MNVVQGDIILLPFPFTDLTHSKKRPAIVVSNHHVNETSDIICAQITSSKRSDAFSFILDNKDLSVKLDLESEIRTHKLFTADKSSIIKKISYLKKSKHKDLFKKICENIEP